MAELRDRFWERFPLAELNSDEWEALCDGCAKCCLIKLQDPDTDELTFTNVACKLLDCKSCRCTDYPNRKRIVPDCVVLTPENMSDLDWMPSTCAYRKLRDGEELPFWHPLQTGRAETVEENGISARGRIVSERDVALEDLDDHVTDWPV